VIHIVSGADERFVPGLVVALGSALFSLPADRPVTIHVLDGGLSQISVGRIQSLAARTHPGCAVFFCPVDEALFAGLRPGIGNSRMYYARLGMGELIQADKAVYLDADVVVTGNLEELWNIGMGENVLLAAHDRKIRFLREDCPWPLPHQEGEAPYFNTGVMVVNLRRWREEAVGPRAMALAAEAGDRCQWYDQTVINHLLRGQIGRLSDSWNWQREEIPEEPPIGAIHFTTGKKPWLFWGPGLRFRIWRSFYFLAGGSPRDYFRRRALSGLGYGILETLLRRQSFLRGWYVSLLGVLSRMERDPERRRALQGSISYYTSGPGGPKGDAEMARGHPIIEEVRKEKRRSPFRCHAAP
jgi:lipopolysaccharide biosynthesis glycosyltransferase